MIAIDSAFKLGNTVIDKLFPDKNKAMEFKIKLMELEQNGEFKEIDLRYQAIMAEAQSEDKWTSRARPTFMYVMYVFVLAAIPFGLLFAFSPGVATSVTKGIKLYLEAIPEEMWSLFKWCFLGYSASRTGDKFIKKKK